MPDRPDSSNLFGELHTTLDHEAIVRLFESSSWRTHRAGRDESRLESDLGELVLEATRPFLLHGPIARVVENVNVIADVLRVPELAFALECYDETRQLVLLVTARMPPVDPLALCRKLGVTPHDPSAQETVGIALATIADPPLNGLRHPPENGTSGWYLWGGTAPSTDEDFFQPLHVAHLPNVCPEVLGLLALPPGWRFLSAEHQLELWLDAALLG